MPLQFIFFRFIGYGQIMSYQVGGWEGNSQFWSAFFSVPNLISVLVTMKICKKFSLLFFLLILFSPDFLNKILFSFQNPPYPESEISTQSSFAHVVERQLPYPHARRRKSSPVFKNPVCDSSVTFALVVF